MIGMRYFICRFLKDKRGLGTVEIVIIIAVLVGIALIFRDAIINFAVDIMRSVFGDSSIIDDVGSGGIRESNKIN
jgi:hypothetical protein